MLSVRYLKSRDFPPPALYATYCIVRKIFLFYGKILENHETVDYYLHPLVAKAMHRALNFGILRMHAAVRLFFQVVLRLRYKRIRNIYKCACDRNVNDTRIFHQQNSNKTAGKANALTHVQILRWDVKLGK